MVHHAIKRFGFYNFYKVYIGACLFKAAITQVIDF
jgi:hypothetical protein